MLKTEIKDYLKEHIIADALYTEKYYEQIDGRFLECSVWSASSGYTVTLKREVSSNSRKNVKSTREMFLRKVVKEKDKFVERFNYNDDLEDELFALLNDGFRYEEF